MCACVCTFNEYIAKICNVTVSDYAHAHIKVFIHFGNHYILGKRAKIIFNQSFILIKIIGAIYWRRSRRLRSFLFRTCKKRENHNHKDKQQKNAVFHFAPISAANIGTSL